MIMSDTIINKGSIKRYNKLEADLRRIHGSKYDYTDSIYYGAKEPFVVKCKIHGNFTTTVDSHTNRKTGCIKCAGVHQYTTEEFTEISNKIFNNKYLYSKVSYINNRSRVMITCPIHGDFTQVAAKHLSGKGCPKCSGRLINNTKEFIVFCTKKYKGLHTYEKSIFTRSLDPIIITCKIHGDFNTIPNTYQSAKYGCPACAGKPVVTIDNLLSRFKEVHNDSFDYSNVIYTRMHDNISILCNTCVTCFDQTPRNHLNGNGCPLCQVGGFSKAKPGIVYYLSINNGQAYKIGITNKSVKERFLASDRKHITILKEWYYELGKEAAAHELAVLHEFKLAKYTGDNLLSSGNTELFNYDILGLDTTG